MKTLILVACLLGSAFYFTDGLGISQLSATDAEVSVSYHPSGQKRVSARYVDGVKSGAFEEWHSNGQLAAQGSYSGGLRDGHWSFWDAAGVLDRDRSGLYQAGKLTRPEAE
jgi:antitoxin component YwqK of YwqJK toxin-antitoxin module